MGSGVMRVIVLALCLASGGVVMGLECYLCVFEENDSASHIDPGCKDPFETSDTHTCNPSESCAKTVNDNYPYTAARVCYPTSLCPVQNGCVSSGSVTVCCCSGNLCNGAPSVTVNGLTVIALIMAAKLMCAP